ncbi:hypothetical protein B0J11DRAFT_70660 [Dendryphion nanum]|uniref:Uncharacterized protein n=1 Tax=Dendryphion nanum TaxID=256645 RepID=A0A9P9DI03_9PLEO|nr:hypothetical protein B0J11DRAFT_70660 [Dendryphion nanum]
MVLRRRGFVQLAGRDSSGVGRAGGGSGRNGPRAPAAAHRVLGTTPVRKGVSQLVRSRANLKREFCSCCPSPRPTPQQHVDRHSTLFPHLISHPPPPIAQPSPLPLLLPLTTPTRCAADLLLLLSLSYMSRHPPLRSHRQGKKGGAALLSPGRAPSPSPLLFAATRLPRIGRPPPPTQGTAATSPPPKTHPIMLDRECSLHH